MGSWIPLAIIASLAWGVYVFLFKIAIGGKHHRVSLSGAFGAMSLGILFAALAAFVATNSSILSSSLTGAGVAMASGVVWGTGMACVALALSKPSTTIAKLTPLYNTNTLVATVLGILLLRETHYQMAAVISGAILVVLGGILIARQRHIIGSFESSLGSNLPVGQVRTRKSGPEKWIIYGIIASLTWGLYALLMKLAVSPRYYGIDPFVAFVAMSVGILLVWPSVFVRGKRGVIRSAKTGLMIAFASGITWAVGMLAIVSALFKFEADVARIVPLCNTNTLVATSLGIILLHEARGERRTIIIGAILVVAGGSLVAIS